MPDEKKIKIDTSKAEPVYDADFNIPVGSNVSLSCMIKGGKLRFWTTFIGFEKNKYLITHLPKNLFDIDFRTKPEITARFVKGSLVCGFTSTVIGSITNPVPILFLKYPASILFLNLREKHRASCFFPATIFWESREIEGRVLDISKGGGKIIALTDNNQTLPQITIDEEVFCQMIIDKLENALYVKAVVRRITSEKNKHILGLEFIELPVDIQHIIDDYVKNINEYIEE
jgi:c-di-GMP-binding flagellar brake protein YcgR